MLRISRLLLPVMYSRGGRFTHDAAELAPQARDAGSSLFPALQPGFRLQDSAGTFDYGFIRAALVRELNRVTAALNEAVACCNAAAC